MRLIHLNLRCFLVIGVLCMVLLAVPDLLGQEIKLHSTLEDHTAKVGPITFSPVGKTLATGSMDGTVKLWDLSDPAKPKAFPIDFENPGAIYHLSFSPDGKTLVAGAKGRVTILDVHDRKKVKQIEIGKMTASAPDVVFSSKNNLLVWSYNKKITFWDVASASIVHTIDPAQPKLTRIALSPDGKTLAAAENHQESKRQITFWEVPSGKPLGMISIAHEFGVARIAFTPDGKTLVSTGSDVKGSKGPNSPPPVPPPPKPNSPWHDGDIKLWDVATLTLFKTWRAHDQTIPVIAISPDGKLLASVGLDKLLKLWDFPTGQSVATLEEQVISVAFSSDGTLLATRSPDNTIKLWDLQLLKGK